MRFIDSPRSNFYTCIMDKKETTTGDLAVMIKRGFDQMATKDELRVLDNKITGIQSDMLEELNAMHEDIRYIRRTLDPLVRNDIEQDENIEDLTTRVGHLEQKAKFA